MKRKKVKIHFGNLLLLLIVIGLLGYTTYYLYNYFSGDKDKPNEVDTKYENKLVKKLKSLGYTESETEKITVNLNEEIVNNIDKKYDNLAELSEVKYFHIENIDRYEELIKNSEYDISEVVMRVNTRIDQSFYTNITNVQDQDDPFVIVNKYYALSKDYVPSDLINVGNGQRMKKEAGEALIKMLDDIKNAGLHLQAQSGYRSYDLQSSLYNNYVSRDGKEQADTYSARPGHSEHQTGLAIDVSKDGTLSKAFENTDQFKWLKENAHKYGFILRYPSDKIYMTGYDYEPWHYRYVGIEAATLIKNEGITYEEYMVKYKGAY